MDITGLKQKLAVPALAAIIFLFIAGVSYLRVLDNYELETLDIRFRLRPDIPVSDKIAIIEIGDDTINKLGKWPISRKYHAALLNALSGAGAKAVVFDIFFSEESDLNSDMEFSEAIKRSGNVYLPYVFNIAVKGRRDIPVADRLQEEVLDKLNKFAKGTGFINILPDSDGKFRRVPPIIKYGGKVYPHVCFLVWSDIAGSKYEDMKIEPGKAVRLGKLKVPLDTNSNIIVNFPGKWQDTFRHYSYIDIIDSHISLSFPTIIKREPTLDLTPLKDSICFVGLTATATPDAHPSPFDSLYPGVGVNASLLNSFMTGKFIKRIDKLTNMLVLLVLAFITYMATKKGRKLFGFLLVFVIVIAYVLLAILLFILFGLWVDIIYPVVTAFFVYLGLTFAKYLAEANKTELMEKELGIATKIQQSFLPKENPEFPGLDIAAKMITAKQVGGDLYDYVKIDDGHFGIMIGDVSGKGVPAALYMARVVSEFKTSAIRANDTRQAITRLNNRLSNEEGAGLFVTLSYLVFDIKNKALNYSSGGHLPVILCRQKTGETKLLDAKDGMPLGLFSASFSQESAALEQGDVIVLYTDGVTEAMNNKNEMFGEEKLVNIVKEKRRLSAEELVSSIQDEVAKFEGKQKKHDDTTVIVIRVE